MLRFATPALLTSALLAAACERAPEPTAPGHATFAHGIDTRSPEFNKQLAALRRLTAQFQNLAKADAAGYGVRITPCWYHSQIGGAQGYHYGKPSLIDGTVSLLEPELLMYEPGPAGQLRLVGIEYIVPIDAWQGADPPTLLGQEFHRNEALGIYALHVWLWRHNRAGMFADWNPQVSCRHADESEDRAN